MIKQKNKIKWQKIVPVILLTIACFYCLTTPLEYFFLLAVFSWIKFIIAIPFIIILAFNTGWTKNNWKKKAFLAFVIIVIIYSRDISDRAFLGKQIAYKYLGEDAGFLELYLFNSGKCKITYGGILGVRENHYGTFKMTDSSVLVDTDADISDLTSLTINLKNKAFKIVEL